MTRPRQRRWRILEVARDGTLRYLPPVYESQREAQRALERMTQRTGTQLYAVRELPGVGES